MKKNVIKVTVFFGILGGLFWGAQRMVIPTLQSQRRRAEFTEDFLMKRRIPLRQYLREQAI